MTLGSKFQFSLPWILTLCVCCMHQGWDVTAKIIAKCSGQVWLPRSDGSPKTNFHLASEWHKWKQLPTFSSVWALSPSTEQMSGHYLKRSSAWVNFRSAEWAVILEISFLGYHIGRQGESQILWETIPVNTAIGCMSEGHGWVGNLQPSMRSQRQAATVELQMWKW